MEDYDGSENFKEWETLRIPFFFLRDLRESVFYDVRVISTSRSND